MQKNSLVLAGLIAPLLAFAQDGGLDVDVNLGDGGGGVWYTNPYFLVAVVAFLILLIFIGSRRGNSSNG